MKRPWLRATSSHVGTSTALPSGGLSLVTATTRGRFRFPTWGSTGGHARSVQVDPGSPAWKPGQVLECVVNLSEGDQAVVAAIAAVAAAICSTCTPTLITTGAS